jgi:hypothetical protein
MLYEDGHINVAWPGSLLEGSSKMTSFCRVLEETGV